MVRRMMRRFLFTTLHNIALMLDREQAGRARPIQLQAC